MIIGLCGKAGSGKDTVADFLVRDFGFVKIALADPLKRICREVFDFSAEQLWGPSDKRNEPDFRYCRRPHQQGFDPVDGRPTTIDAEYLTPRHALQKLGTEWGRDCYPDVWIDYAVRLAKRLLIKGAPIFYDAKQGLRSWQMGDPQEIKGIVISDVRFMNEVSGLRSRGARVIRIVRPNQVLKGAAGQHRSETEQDSIPDELFDYIIQNVGSLEDLYELTRGVFSKFDIESRDEKFAQMLHGIDPGAGPDRTALVRVENNVVTEVEVIADKPKLELRRVMPGAPVDLAPLPDADFPLVQPSVKTPDGAEVLPAESPAQERLRGMLEDRQRDVEAGRLIAYDPVQKDVPPFKRRK